MDCYVSIDRAIGVIRSTQTNFWAAIPDVGQNDPMADSTGSAHEDTHRDGRRGPTYEVVWPKSPVGVAGRSPAPRLECLDGARVAFLWDYLFRGDELFPLIEQELTGRFPGLEVVGYDVFGNSHGGDEAEFISRLPQALADNRIDAVISGVGC